MNSYALTGTWPSTMRVCQFHHHGARPSTKANGRDSHIRGPPQGCQATGSRSEIRSTPRPVRPGSGHGSGPRARVTGLLRRLEGSLRGLPGRPARSPRSEPRRSPRSEPVVRCPFPAPCPIRAGVLRISGVDWEHVIQGPPSERFPAEVPVGTRVTPRPPGGSVRARFGHTALALDAGDRSERSGKSESRARGEASGP